MDPVIETAQFDVTCREVGCENADITLRVTATASAPIVICGPCGIQIEDVTAP